MNDDLTGGTRRVSVTHDGKRIGHTEPLSDPDNPFRKRCYKANTAKGRQHQIAFSERFLERGRQASARKRGSAGNTIRSNQKRSLTMRAK